MKNVKENKMSLREKFDYWQMCDDLGYSLKCKDDVMHALYDGDVQRILLNERKRLTNAEV